MKRIAIGLSAYDSKNLAHQGVELSADGDCIITKGFDSIDNNRLSDGEIELFQLPAHTVLRLSRLSANLSLEAIGLRKCDPVTKIILRPKSTSTHLFVQFPPHSGTGAPTRSYTGEVVVMIHDYSLRVFVQCTLEEYLRGVLNSEIPASYHLEAIKAQAVAARTYALNPRVDHKPDQCHVCDSFLCCQCFLGAPPLKQASHHQEAIEATRGKILVYQDKPILALFSSNAGGHTENYESCFSDFATEAFPPQPIPYLKGVPEGILPSSYTNPPNSDALSALWHCKTAGTCDAWAPQFKWSVKLPGDSLEAHMHHTVDKMLNCNQFAPFVIPPIANTFGQIKSFEVLKRGVGGTAVALAVNTSKGTWLFKKELVIRSIFENHELRLPRLKSARIFFEHELSALGLITNLSIYGLGTGHGVGLQQTGAEGLARSGKNYESILSHYFKGAYIDNI